ncbi:MAG: PorV/PorQ family protein [Bacteroidota bacterium]|nr:PorV/PorQ family protein [Bacteroidota bacterium]
MFLFSVGACAVPAAAQLIPFLGGQRAGISSLQFLKIAPGARAAAMAEAFTALADDPTALHFNPAGIARMDGFQVTFSHTAWLVDIRHEYAAVTYRLSPADAVGVSITSLGTDDMEIRTETQPFGTGRYFSYGDIGVTCTYARSLTDRFSAGITIRYAEEKIDALKTRAVMVDIGTFYLTGLGSTRFAVTVNNFGANISPAGSITQRDGSTVSSFQDFSPPTVFRIGFAFEPYEDEHHRLTASIQLNHPNDNSENLGVGAEYAWERIFFARAGYKINTDEEGLTAGVGISAPLGFARTGVDYAFSLYKTLNSVHRVTITLAL